MTASGLKVFVRSWTDFVRSARTVWRNYDLGGVYDEINQELSDLVDAERQALDDRSALADMELADPDLGAEEQRAAEMAKDATGQKHMQLDMLADDLAGKVRGLQNYDFESNAAQQRFDDLLDRLRQQLVEQQFNQMSEAMSDMGPEEMSRLKDMMAELNRMLEQRANGEEPDFDKFMEEYGDFSPATRRTWMSCWRRWLGRWRRCRPCSTR